VFVKNEWFVGFDYTDALAGAVPAARGRGVVSVKLVQRLARKLGELLSALATPAALGAPRKWS
jgi:hypothetical protein